MKSVLFALAALCLAGIASAQNAPPIQVFGGYSYLNLNISPSLETNSEQLALNGWEASVAVGLLHRLSIEADISGHRANGCSGTTLTCSNLSYLFGPRYTFADHSGKINVFLHALVGQDRLTIVDLNTAPLSDTSVAVAGGVGFEYWMFRRVGFQFGPADFIYTDHLRNEDGSSQNSYRVAVGVDFRFGGELPPAKPKPPKKPKAKAAPQSQSKSHRSWLRPWHKTKPAETEPTEGQPEETQTPAPAPANQPAAAPAPAPAPQPKAHRSWWRPWHKTQPAPAETQPSGTQPTGTQSQAPPANQPAPASQPAPPPKAHRSWWRPWHKTQPAPVETQPNETQPSGTASSTSAGHNPSAAPETTSAPTHGLLLRPLGAVFVPQNFDGAKIAEVEPGSVAEMAALKPGDLIKAVDGKPVRTPMELAAALSGRTGKVRITIARGKWMTETEVVLGK
ncbi:MAG: PDZ domain-containing protein [Terriglobales bacterium]